MRAFHGLVRLRRRVSTVRLRFWRFFEYDRSLRSVAWVSRTDRDFFATEIWTKVRNSRRCDRKEKIKTYLESLIAHKTLTICWPLSVFSSTARFSVFRD